MTDTVDNITIVGGGDTGLLTGLILQRLNPGVDIEVVDDFDSEIAPVGKSTYLAIRNVLHDTLGIEEQRFVDEVRPVWKGSLYFRDWCDYQPFHYPFDIADKFPEPESPDAIEQHYYYYDEVCNSQDHRTKGEQLVEQEQSPWYYDVSTGGYECYRNTAYHLNTERFESFLRDVCRERGVSLVSDQITDVETTGNHVDAVRSKRQRYESDLYVDASGFNRVIRSEQDGEYVDFNFPLDSAFNARVERPLSEIIPATIVETGDYGWYWHIDTYDHRDFGYVFASDYVSDEDALAEFVEYWDGVFDPEDAVKLEFESGYYPEAWQDNCVTIGNAEGFVEPLQSTGLVANAQATVTLANLLSSHGRINDAGIRDRYNKWVTRSWESIYDFIAVHYKFSTGETEFWQDMENLAVSDRVEHLVEEFDENGFDTNVDPTMNEADVEDLLIFRPRNFYMLMRNMGATSEFYEEHDFEVSEDVRRQEDDYYQRVADEVESYHTVEEFYKGLLQV
mgnify:FL=1